jgi:hypothetical protein
VLTGLGGEIFIIDDPMKPDEAFSDDERVRVNTWFRHTALRRSTSPRSTRRPRRRHAAS